jgi:hypothetical protein
VKLSKHMDGPLFYLFKRPNEIPTDT